MLLSLLQHRQKFSTRRNAKTQWTNLSATTDNYLQRPRCATAEKPVEGSLGSFRTNEGNTLQATMELQSHLQLNKYHMEAKRVIFHTHNEQLIPHLAFNSVDRRSVCFLQLGVSITQIRSHCFTLNQAPYSLCSDKWRISQRRQPENAKTCDPQNVPLLTDRSSRVQVCWGRRFEVSDNRMNNGNNEFLFVLDFVQVEFPNPKTHSMNLMWTFWTGLGRPVAAKQCTTTVVLRIIGVSFIAEAMFEQRKTNLFGKTICATRSYFLKLLSTVPAGKRNKPRLWSTPENSC